MVYADKDKYLTEYSTIPESEIEKRLKQASRHIDSLTFNRIAGIGYDNLTGFQKDILTDVCCSIAEFEYENEDLINCVLQQYSLNGASMQFGNSWNITVQNGVAVRKDIYQELSQTGLCCRSLRGW